jgi:hypothetical protein
MTHSIARLVSRIVDEQATGIPQQGKRLVCYVSESLAVHPKQALAMLADGRAASIHVPAAGAGSYRDFFASLGFSAVQALDQTSRAGDWSFAVKHGDRWYPATQTNRYPRHGFEYTVDFRHGFGSIEDLCRFHEL